MINESNHYTEVICRRHGLENYTINSGPNQFSTKIVDVDGDVDLNDHELTEFPLKFGTVTGDFNCSNNKLTTLKGAPNRVGGAFVCYYNELTSLEHCPTEVGGSIRFDHNKLTSLEHCPKEIIGSFSIDDNELTSLEHCPIRIEGRFDCSSNKLTTLEYCPEYVRGAFHIGWNDDVKDLNGFNTEFGDRFHTYGCPIGELITDFYYDELKIFKTYKVLKDGVVNLKRYKYVMGILERKIDEGDIEGIEKQYKIV